MKLIAYTGDDEVIVTSLDREHETIQSYFTEGGRKLDEYDREEVTDEAVSITLNSSLRISY
jgi:hypothetical protein